MRLFPTDVEDAFSELRVYGVSMKFAKKVQTSLICVMRLPPTSATWPAWFTYSDGALVTPPVQPDGGQMLGVLHRTAWVLVTIGALLMFLLATPYFFFGPRCRSGRSGHGISQGTLPPVGRQALDIHAFAMMFPLIIGPVQFLLRRLTPEARRARYLPLHRWLGRIYVAGALIGGLAGLYLAIYAHGGFASALGFGSWPSLRSPPPRSLTDRSGPERILP